MKRKSTNFIHLKRNAMLSYKEQFFMCQIGCDKKEFAGIVLRMMETNRQYLLLEGT